MPKSSGNIAMLLAASSVAAAPIATVRPSWRIMMM